MSLRLRMLCLTGFGLLLSQTARSAVIVEPFSAASTMSVFYGSPTYLVNQSGLSATYTSGVTDFSSFVASTTALTAVGYSFAASQTSGNIDFDLGSILSVDELALWGREYNSNQNVDAFKLYASSDSSFTSPTLIGSFVNNPTGNNDTVSAVKADVFSFGSVTTRYIRLEIDSNYGGGFTTLDEVAFEETSVPEPATYGMLLVGGLLLAAGRRRKRHFC